MNPIAGRRREERGQRSSQPGGEQKNTEQVDVRKNSQGWDPRTHTSSCRTSVLVKVMTDQFAL